MSNENEFISINIPVTLLRSDKNGRTLHLPAERTYVTGKTAIKWTADVIYRSYGIASIVPLVVGQTLNFSYDSENDDGDSLGEEGAAIEVNGFTCDYEDDGEHTFGLGLFPTEVTINEDGTATVMFSTKSA